MKLWAFKTGQELNSINLLDVASDDQVTHVFRDSVLVFCLIKKNKISIAIPYDSLKVVRK